MMASVALSLGAQILLSEVQRETDAQMLELEMDASCLSQEHTLSPALPRGDASYSAGNLHLTRENANNARRTFRLVSTQINARSKESLLTTSQHYEEIPA